MVLLEVSQQPNSFASTPLRRHTLVIDGRLASLDRLSKHRKLLEHAVARFGDDVRVVGLVAGGSLAHGAADFYSDVDLYIVVQDEAFGEIFAERDAIVEAVGSPLFGFIVDPVPGGSTDHIVLYEGPVKFDFMYLKKSDFTPALKWAGCVVLKDARGRVWTVLSQSGELAPPHPTTEELLDLNQKFWTWCSGMSSARSCGASCGKRWMASIASAAWPSCPCWTGLPRDPMKATGDWSAKRTQRRHHV
jgi:predicted nucleotidyltransferase